MSAPAFEVEITSQGWLGADDPDLTYDPARVDLCTHGALRLTIGGQMISAGAEPEEYGISESALALLRALESDHSPAAPVAERLVLHGCGTILMMGCPVGIDWSVSHHHGQVRIHDVVRYDTVDEAEAVQFPDLTAELSEDDYRRQIAAFAVRAKEPFEGTKKVIDDDWERGQYEEFWAEFDARLGRAEAALMERR